ncbi:MAG: hypothetical protein ACI4AA_00270 [Lachnospiraceae bacterium]
MLKISYQHSVIIDLAKRLCVGCRQRKMNKEQAKKEYEKIIKEANRKANDIEEAKEKIKLLTSMIDEE